MAYSWAMKRLLLLVILLSPPGLQAETVYRIVHPDGTVEFTDDPRRGGEQLKVDPVPTIPATVVAPRSSNSPRDTRPAETAYQQIRISSPENDQVIWFDGSGLNIRVQIEPGLQSGHRIAIEMDGERVAEASSTDFNLPTVFRGTHTLRALVLDAQGETLKGSDPVSFHFRQHTRIKP